jgi:hypothetical protein
VKQKIVKLEFGLKQQKKPILSLSRQPTNPKNGLNRGLIQKPTKISMPSSRHYYSLMLRVFDGFQRWLVRMFSGDSHMLILYLLIMPAESLASFVYAFVYSLTLLKGLSLDVNHAIVDF